METKVKIKHWCSKKGNEISWFLNIVENGLVTDTLQWKGLYFDNYFWDVTTKESKFSIKQDSKGRFWELVLNRQSKDSYRINIYTQTKKKQTRQKKQTFDSLNRTEAQNNKYFVFNEVILPELDRWGIEEIKYACWEVTKFLPKAPKVKENKWIRMYFNRKPVSLDLERVILLALVFLNKTEENEKVRKADIEKEVRKIERIHRDLDKYVDPSINQMLLSGVESDESIGGSSSPSSIVKDT